MGIRRLGISNPAANTATTIFAADDQYLMSIVATNLSGVNSANIRVWVEPSGSASVSQYAFIVHDIPVDQTNSYETFRFAVNQNDLVRVQASSASISFQAYGLVQYDVKLGIGTSSYQPNSPFPTADGMIWVDSDAMGTANAKPAYVYSSASSAWIPLVGGIDTSASYSFTANNTFSGNNTFSASNSFSAVNTFSQGINSNGNSVFTTIQEQIVNASISASVMNADFNNGSTFYLASSPSSNFKLNLTNLPTTNLRTSVINVIVTQGATGYYPNTIDVNGQAQTIKWAYNVVPTPTSGAGKIDIYSFSILRISSSWIILGSFTLNF